MRRLPFAALVLLVVLTGCTAAPELEPIVPVPPALSSSPGPVGLVNLWRVGGIDDDNVWLRLADRELVVWADCGIGGGTWRAAGGMFLADVQSGFGTSGCMNEPAALDWLYAATSFESGLAQDSWNLLDADGDIVATLRIDGTPPASADISADYLRAPVVTQATRDLLDIGSFLAVQSDFDNLIEGRWSASTGFVEFAADGTWTGSDGCNSGSGRWLRADGLFLATDGVTTAMWCEGAPVPSWVAAAVGVQKDGDVLRLVGKDGATLGTVVR